MNNVSQRQHPDHPSPGDVVLFCVHAPHAIEQGRLTDCVGRDEQGRRVWTAEEVERAVERFGDSLVLDSPIDHSER